MEGYSLFITVVLTLLAIFLLERLYQARKPKEDKVEVFNNRRKHYREDGFKEVIKINEASLHHGTLDQLTSLPGRQIYDERLNNILAYSKKYNKIFSVMILNIDQFSHINQIYGEAFGNRLLIEVANRLKTVLRQIDTTSRYAGDCFFFILPELSTPEVAVLVAQRIQDSIIQPFYIDEKRVFITACIGIVIYSAEDQTPESLIKSANEALAKAKLAGRNNYRINNILEEPAGGDDASLSSYFETEDFLEKMVVYYQPYFNVNSQQTLIVQAVPYFSHQRMGLVPYNKFNMAVEENGLLDDLGKWQIQKAIAQLQHWDSNEFKVDKLMVSVSLAQFENPQFFETISALIAETGIDKKRVILDITKHNVSENSQVFKEILVKVRGTGLNVSIGIMELGRLALHNILEFPIDYLKIDEKLVKNLILRVDNEAIISSLIAISNNANIAVIAEGVDFENQKNKLIELGCNIMQGRYFSAPMPANELFDIEVSKKHLVRHKEHND